MKLTNENMRHATELAKKATRKMKVRVASFGNYEVFSPESFKLYTVKLWKQGNVKHGECSCKAGEFNQVCKHIGAALGIHIVMASERQSNVVSFNQYKERMAA